MNKCTILSGAILTLLSTAGAAFAANDLVIAHENVLFNRAEIAVEGNGNRLAILQQGGAPGALNSLEVSLTGDDNGAGPLGASFSGAALTAGLMPGHIEQTGLNNQIKVAIEGSGNLFALTQNGNGNGIDAVITGRANQAVVMQAGNDNYSSISQNGVGNIVSIMQKSW